MSRLSRNAVRWLVAAGLACLLIAALTIATAGAAESGAEGDHLVISDVSNVSTAQGVTLVRVNGLGSSDGANWALPTTTSGPNQRFTIEGSTNAEGALARSANGKYITLAGTTAAVGGNAESTDARVVARVNAAGTVDTSTTLGTTFINSKVRGAVTNDGNEFWVTGNGNTNGSTPLGGMIYQPDGSTSTPTVIVSKEAPSSSSNAALNNFRTVQIAGGNLYTGSEKGTAGIYQVTGLPTKPTAPSNPIGLSVDPISELPLEHEVGSGKVDLMYVAKEKEGIYKYSLSGSTWTERGRVVSGTFTAVTGKVDSAGHFRLSAISGEGSGNSVVTVTDSAAFNAAPSVGTTKTVTSAPSGTAFRGIAFAPEAEANLPGAPTEVKGTAGNGKVTLSWSAPSSNGGSAITEYKIVPFKNGTEQTAIKTSSTETSRVIEGLTNGTPYTFTVAAITANGTGPASTASAAVTPQAPGAPVPTISISDEHLEGTNGDPTNPTITVTVAQEGVAASELSVAASASTNTAVAATSGVTVEGTGATRTVSIAPAGGVGTADITLKVTGKESKTATVVLHYAASKASSTPATTRYHTGAADGSTAIDVGQGYMLIGDDESNTLRLYKDSVSGAPVKEWNFDPQMGEPEEIDIEASARAGNTIYWTGSMGNSKKGNLKPERSTLFSTKISGEGAATELTFGGYYRGLRADLIKWDEEHGNRFGFAAGAAEGNVPKQVNGFNVEGLEFAPGSTSTAYVGFRAPLTPASANGKAIIVPVTNLNSLATSGQNTSVHATFGEPILMNLEGLSIREIRKNAAGEYLIIAGSWAGSGPQALYTWDGKPADAPVKATTNIGSAEGEGEDGGAWEGVGALPNTLTSGEKVTLVMDDGAVDFYNTGQEAKELVPEWQKSPSNEFTLELPVVNVAPQNTAVPTLSGESKVGGTLACSTGEWTGKPTPTFTYEWQRDGAQIAGAGGSEYTAVAADGGHQVRCVVTATNAAGKASANSAATTINAAPAEVTAPTVGGTPRAGETLTCVNGKWSGTPAPSFAFAWLRDGKPFAGGEASTYEATSADVGQELACKVTATNSVGSASATAAAVTVEAALAEPANVTAPSLSGGSRAGETLTCAPGEWTGNPTPALTYAWLRDGTPIAGAEASTYEATSADVGHEVACKVTGTNSVGSASATSAAVTVAAAFAAPTNVTAPTLSGVPHVGTTLTCTQGEWTGNPEPTYTYGWLRDGVEIAEASGPTYTTVAADGGHQVRCVVTATNSVGHTEATSNALIVGASTCTGGPISGQGSTLQAPAQQILWSPGFKALCGNGDEVTYNPTSSGASLSSWGFAGGKFDNSSAFIGTDDAPSPTQIAAANAASGSNVLVIPVAQTAIGIVVNPPSGCEIEEITNVQLEAVLSGAIKNWGKLLTATGAGCTGAPITRVVRAEGSGTTYQLKAYLQQIDPAPLPCVTGGRAWRELEEIGAAEEPNTVWPHNSVAGCAGATVSPIVTAAGGSGVVKAVNTTEGSLGYAALPDIEANKANGENPHGDTNWLKLQNNGLTNKLANAQTVAPTLENTDAAACAGTPYYVPPAARTGKTGPVNVNWSNVLGGNPNMAGSTGNAGTYPLCTLTYDIALTNYAKAGFSETAEQTVKDYLGGYVLGSAGQGAANRGGQFYASLPSEPGNPFYDVLAAAQATAGRIGF